VWNVWKTAVLTTIVIAAPLGIISIGMFVEYNIAKYCGMATIFALLVGAIVVYAELTKTTKIQQTGTTAEEYAKQQRDKTAPEEEAQKHKQVGGVR